MKIVKFLTLFLLNQVNCLVLTNIFTDRRSIVANTIFSPTYEIYKKPLVNDSKVKKDNIDLYSQWSFYGLVPPPIEKIISQKELTDEILKDNILSLQIAVQHDIVIATSKNNHRLSCEIKDKDFNEYISQFKNINNDLPFQVIPIDSTKQKIRSFAKIFFGLYIFKFFTFELPNNIRLLKSCNTSMTTRQKIIFLLENQNRLNLTKY